MTRPLKWCDRKESNFHGSPHSDLNAARLPIPPRPLLLYLYQKTNKKSTVFSKNTGFLSKNALFYQQKEIKNDIYIKTITV